jgi:surface antigen
MKKHVIKFWLLIGNCIPFFLILPILAVFLYLLGANQENESSAQDSTTTTGVTYVAHWSGSDAYHHDFLAQRYGITAEQIDGFIASQGFSNLDKRATGEAFLEAQSSSGIDVRVLVTFAQWESSYGTAGVAKSYPEANLWGYGCFDNDPNQGRDWPSERAYADFRAFQIEKLGNRTLAILDEKASKYNAGDMSVQVYWTASGDIGKKRATTMEALDKYIDEHGGTPEPPSGYGTTGGKGNITVLNQMLGNRIGSGECYAVAHYYSQALGGPALVGHMYASEIGTDYAWAIFGWTVDTSPTYDEIRAGDIINFSGPNAIYPSEYGHTAVVASVDGNGKLTIYDQNPHPLTLRQINSEYIKSLIHP